jgi:peptidoglycan DL-endopeptidase CwlO
VTNRPLSRGRLSSSPAPLRSARRTAPALVVAFVAVLAAADVPALADPTIGSKKAEAQGVLAQIQQLDSSLERAVEVYNLANIKLDRIRRDLADNTRKLAVARRSLETAQRHLSSRLVDLYTSGGEDATLAVLLGASNLDDLLSRIDAADRVADQDTVVLRQVTRFNAEVRRRQRNLRNADEEQKQVVDERAAARASIESQLAQRRELLSSIRSEIAQLRQQERERQAELRRQLQARLAAQQQAAREQAIAPPAVSTAPTPPPTSAPPPSRYGGVVVIAMRYLGVPYVWGGASPSGFDCSGFVMYVYAQVGISLPHYTVSQYAMGTAVSRGQLQPGDVVFFDGLGHNGIYIGNNQFIHAPHTGDVVKISSITGWYASTFVGARRF